MVPGYCDNRALEFTKQLYKSPNIFVDIGEITVLKNIAED